VNGDTGITIIDLLKMPFGGQEENWEPRQH